MDANIRKLKDTRQIQEDDHVMMGKLLKGCACSSGRG